MSEDHRETIGAAMPKRIQLSRKKGWRKPARAVVVARPSAWGNPFLVGGAGVPDRATAVALFRSAVLLSDWAERVSRQTDALLLSCLMECMPGPVPRLDAIRMQLRGRDLACWCPVDCACHADVLLELANADQMRDEKQ